MMSEYLCKVESITPLTTTVFKVILTPNASFKFKAGQYIMVHMSEEDKRPFSIANAAFDDQRIELHIGADANNTYATQVLERMHSEQQVLVSGGHGDAYLRMDGQPIILIAGGTGFSYTYSILQQALHDGYSSPIKLYWGTRHAEDLYLHNELGSLAQQYANFSYVPVVEFAHDDWPGRTGWVHHAVEADYPTLAGNQVYVAGRFDMAKAIRTDFTARGLNPNNLFGDAYAFI